MDKQRRRYAIQLASQHISELPREEVIKAAPSHYGTELTDEHRLFVWNGLVEHYLELDDHALYRAYKQHIVEQEPIVKFRQWAEMSPDEQQLVNSIVQAIWEGKH